MLYGIGPQLVKEIGAFGNNPVGTKIIEKFKIYIRIKGVFRGPAARPRGIAHMQRLIGMAKQVIGKIIKHYMPSMMIAAQMTRGRQLQNGTPFCLIMPGR